MSPRAAFSFSSSDAMASFLMFWMKPENEWPPRKLPVSGVGKSNRLQQRCRRCALPPHSKTLARRWIVHRRQGASAFVIRIHQSPHQTDF
jgi:hypothetical protein